MKEQEKFTIEEIRNYIHSCDSFGDVAYFLSAEKIREANTPKELDEDEEVDDDEGFCGLPR